MAFSRATIPNSGCTASTRRNPTPRTTSRPTCCPRIRLKRRPPHRQRRSTAKTPRTPKIRGVRSRGWKNPPASGRWQAEACPSNYSHTSCRGGAHFSLPTPRIMLPGSGTACAIPGAGAPRFSRRSSCTLRRSNPARRSCHAGHGGTWDTRRDRSTGTRRPGTRRGLVAVGERAHDDGLAGDLAFDGGNALHADGVGTPVEDGDFDAELVAGNDGTTEAGVVDAGEDGQLGGALCGGVFGEQERRAGLRDGFNHQNGGHDGKVGKVAGKVRLVDGDVLEGDNAGFALHFDDAVDEEKWIAVREDGHDFQDVHRVGGWIDR